MNTKQRILTIQLTGKIKSHPDYAKQIGIEVKEQRYPQIKLQ